MRKLLYTALLVLACSFAKAQDIEPAIDSTLVGANIFATMPAGVKIHQSPAIRSAMFGHISRNAQKQFTGFRIRIFNESVPNARSLAEAAEARFQAIYPGIETVSTYTAPFFNVTVGNFRTRVDAERALRSIKGDFPSAVIVKERFRFPSLSAGMPQPADTITVFKLKK